MTRKKSDIVKEGEKTRFKKGNKAGKGGDTATYRNQLRWVRDQEIDMNDLEGSFRRLAGIRAVKGKSPINVSRLFAIRYVERAIKKGDPILFDKVIDQTEGKLSQEIIQKVGQIAPEAFTDIGEAEAAYAQYIKGRS